MSPTPAIDESDSFRGLVRECLDDTAGEAGFVFNELYRDGERERLPAGGSLFTRGDSRSFVLVDALRRLFNWRGQRASYTRAFSVLYESSDPAEALRARYPELLSHYGDDPIISLEMWITYYPDSNRLTADIDVLDIVEWACRNQPELADVITDPGRALRERLTAIATALRRALR